MLALCVYIAQTKVYNFDVAIAIQQQILRFQVSMDYPKLMQVFHRIQNLLEDATRLPLFQPFVVYDVVE